MCGHLWGHKDHPTPPVVTSRLSTKGCGPCSRYCLYDGPRTHSLSKSEDAGTKEGRKGEREGGGHPPKRRALSLKPEETAILWMTTWAEIKRGSKLPGVL